jgi:SAM-dependent methyltransferase
MVANKIIDRIRKYDSLRRLQHWCRYVMEKSIEERLATISLCDYDAIEISGNARGALGFRSYQPTYYPEFDICRAPSFELQADIVFCEQVLEHVRDPVNAVANISRLLRPGGLAIISVPFLIRIHREPEDYWRFSAQGLRTLLEGAGLQVERVETWGNRLALIANTWYWIPYFPVVMPLFNDPDIPLVVWAFARKPDCMENNCS